MHQAGNSELEARITKIENYLKSGGQVRQAKTSTVETKSVAKKANNEAKPKFSGETQKFWPEIVNDLKSKGKMGLYANLIGTVAKEINDVTIGIEFPNGMTPFGKTILENPDNIKTLTDLVSIAKGKEMHIKYIDSGNKASKASEDESIETFANGFDLPFNVIE